jgi:hypothetical protein
MRRGAYAQRIEGVRDPDGTIFGSKQSESIKNSIRNRFNQMVRLDDRGFIEVRDRSGESSNSIECPSTQAQLLDGRDEILEDGIRHGASLLQRLSHETGVHTQPARSAESPGETDSLADCSGRQSIGRVEKPADRQRRHWYMEIEAIEDRTADAAKVAALRRPGTRRHSSAFPRGVHGADDDRTGGKTGGARHSGNGHHTVFEWFAKRVDRCLGEFREFVEHENAVMGKTHLARTRRRAASNQRRRTAGVMW